MGCCTYAWARRRSHTQFNAQCLLLIARVPYEAALSDVLDAVSACMGAGSPWFIRTPAAENLSEHAWLQGRLIPGSNLASVPFIDELRAKMRTSGGKEDGLPDECFTRLRGALFVGPSWSVTRNKLKLRYVVHPPPPPLGI